LFTGIPDYYKEAWNSWAHLWSDVSSTPHPPIPPPKVFKPKYPEIPRRASYRRQFKDQWWDKFLTHYVCPGESLVGAKQLQKLANTLGCTDTNRLNRVTSRLRDGADIGCNGHFREPSTSTNADSAYQYSPEVTDAIAAWVQKGFAYGPVHRADVPRSAKINGIMVRPKPNGSARIILNLSAPKGKSVNDGINSDDFPATMSSTTAWLQVLYKAGRNCWISKTDWSDAYKHFAVRQEDTDLQWFEWGGRFFKELDLIFGACSSAGIFDDGAKVVLDFVCRHAQFPRSMVCQHLDDVCAAAPDNSLALQRFDDAFITIADYVGVALAPRDDPDKSFGPSKAGTVFGVHYDTSNWTWRIPEEKLARLLANITDALNEGTVHKKTVKSIAGKLIHIKPLIPAGKFHFDAIMNALALSDSQEHVTLSAQARAQLEFWTTLLRTCSGNTVIPFPFHNPPPWALNAFTDAAGGSATNKSSGTGGCLGEWWFWLPWPKRIQHGILKHDGKKIGRKLTALELVGPLIAIAANLDTCRYRPVTIWVDNIGSVGVWEKGYSNSCSLSTTLVKATNAIACAVGCELFIRKITRCSNHGARVADALSKGDFVRASKEAADSSKPLQLEPARIPASLLRWINNPTADDELGHRILMELSERTPLLRCNNTRAV